MPNQPTRSDVHVNRPMTNFSIAYIQSATHFIASQVFPMVPVMKQSDRYFVYLKSDWFRAGAQKRAPGTESAGGGYRLDNTPNYFADVWAYHKDVDDQTRANADEPLNMDRDATIFTTQNCLLRREISFVTSYMAASTWTGGPGGSDYNVSTSATCWDLAGSDPMAVVNYLQNVVLSGTGYEPNTLLVANDIYAALKNNAAVLDRIKYTQRGIVTAELLAALFGVEKFLVAKAVVNTAAESVSDTPTMSFVVSNLALLVYANPSPSIMQPTGGYIFSWKGMFGAGAEGARTKTFRMEHLESDRVETEMAYSMKLIGADLGVLLTNVLATA